MSPKVTHVASLGAHTRVMALLLAMLARAGLARARMGGETGRPRPTRPPRYWPKPSSTEGGRPWPPAPPYW